jgi:hypothetical protein
LLPEGSILLGNSAGVSTIHVFSHLATASVNSLARTER